MATNEEATILVSESNNGAIVKEAFEGEQQSLPLPEEEEQTVRMPSVDKPKTWLDSQEAKDFMPFLVGEMKRIKAPNACVRSRNEAERALGQSKRLNNYISKALREDWADDLPITDVDKLRQLLEQNIEALERMLDAQARMRHERRQVGRRRRASDNSLCPKCAQPLWEEDGDIVCVACDGTMKKEAGTPFPSSLQVQLSAFEHAITGILINATISGGRNLEEVYKELKGKYKFTDREELALLQIMENKGYPVFKDRARIGENEDPTNPDKPREWQSQYYA